jgi:hypothetical protein
LHAGLDDLDGALDRAERVADLVGEAGGHLPERGEAVALLALLVHLRVLDHHGGLGDDAGEQLDLLAGERLEQALVLDEQHAEQVEARACRRRGGCARGPAALRLAPSSCEGLEALVELGLHLAAGALALALQHVAQLRAVAQALEQRAAGREVEAGERGRAEVAAQGEREALAVDEEEGGAGDPLDSPRESDDGWTISSGSMTLTRRWRSWTRIARRAERSRNSQPSRRRSSSVRSGSTSTSTANEASRVLNTQQHGFVGEAPGDPQQEGGVDGGDGDDEERHVVMRPRISGRSSRRSRTRVWAMKYR